MVPLTSLRALGGSLCPAVKPKFCIWRAMAQAALAGCGTWPGPDVRAMLMLPTLGQLLLWLNLSHLGCTAFPLLPYLPKSCLRPSLPLVCLYPRIWPGSGSSGPSAHTFIEWSVTRPPPPQGLPWPPLFSQPAPSTPLGLLWSPQGGVTLSASTSPSPHPEPAVVGLQYHRLGDQLVFKEVHCPVSFLSLSLASVSGHLSLPLARLKCVPKIIHRLLLDTPRCEHNVEEPVPLRTGRQTSLKSLKLQETSDTCSCLWTLYLFWFLATPHTAGRILVPWLGIEPRSPTVEAWSPNHCTTREFPMDTFSECVEAYSTQTEKNYEVVKTLLKELFLQVGLPIPFKVTMSLLLSPV